MRRITAVATLVAMATALTFAATSSASGGLPTLTLSMTKKTIEVGGQMTSGAVKIRTTVSGESADDPTLILLKPGVSVAEFAKAVSKIGKGPLDAIDPYGTLVFSGQTTHKGKPTVAEAVLPAGTYAALGDGNAHAVFTITKSTAPAALPKAAATLTAIDFGFRGPSKLHDGELVRLKNHGFLIHMFAWGMAETRATADHAAKLLLAGNSKAAGALAKSFGSFAGPLSSGQEQQEVIDEKPGYYVMYCAMTSQDGRPHFMLGMVKVIHIVR